MGNFISYFQQQDETMTTYGNVSKFSTPVNKTRAPGALPSTPGTDETHLGPITRNLAEEIGKDSDDADNNDVSMMYMDEDDFKSVVNFKITGRNATKGQLEKLIMKTIEDNGYANPNDCKYFFKLLFIQDALYKDMHSLNNQEEQFRGLLEKFHMMKNEQLVELTLLETTIESKLQAIYNAFDWRFYCAFSIFLFTYAFEKNLGTEKQNHLHGPLLVPNVENTDGDHELFEQVKDWLEKLKKENLVPTNIDSSGHDLDDLLAGYMMWFKDMERANVRWVETVPRDEMNIQNLMTEGEQLKSAWAITDAVNDSKQRILYMAAMNFVSLHQNPSALAVSDSNDNREA